MAVASMAVADRGGPVTVMHGSDIDPSTQTPINRVLQCIATIFETEEEARAVVYQLRHEHGLKTAQVQLLRPSDAAPMRYARLNKQWASRGHLANQPLLADRWIAACAGALLATTISTLWLVLDVSLQIQDQVTLLALAGLCGAAIGAVISMAMFRPVRPRRFNASVQHHLTEGDYVVVAHGVPWSRQSSVLGLMRNTGIKWCAAARPHQRI